MSVILRSIKAAWRLLSEKGSRFRMILAGVLILFAFVTPMMFGIYLPSAVIPTVEKLIEYINELLRQRQLSELVFRMTDEMFMSIVYDLTAFIGFFVTLPAYAWFFTYSWNTYSRARYGFADRERIKGDYNYFRSLLSGLVLLARPIICFAMLQLGYLLARVISEETVYDGLAIPMIALLIPFWAVAIFLSVLFLWVTNSSFLMPYYYGRGMTLRQARRLSKEKCARHPFYCDLFSVIFGVMSAISLLSVGVVFVLMILPLMMFTYFTLAEHMDGKKLLED